jgi:hypothetical protein
MNLFISAIAIRLVCAGKFVGDSKCEKLPIEICGAGCTFEVRDHLLKSYSFHLFYNPNVLQCALRKFALLGIGF